MDLDSLEFEKKSSENSPTSIIWYDGLFSNDSVILFLSFKSFDPSFENIFWSTDDVLDSVFVWENLLLFSYFFLILIGCQSSSFSRNLVVFSTYNFPVMIIVSF